jgi:hypothetical protein
MKVLDLQCAEQHLFEGWFASEEDFSEQRSREAIQCPMCGNTTVVKRLSAPRLSFGASQAVAEGEVTAPIALANASGAVAQRLWLQTCRGILANTVDVGSGFAEAARKIHYGESTQRAIRGQATLAQAQALVDEGIEVLPFVVPEALSGTQH